MVLFGRSGDFFLPLSESGQSCLNVCDYRGPLNMKPLQNLTIFATLVTRMGFSEVTGGRALSFRNVSMGETAGPYMFWVNAEGAKLPRRYVVEKISPRALELKKSASSLRKYELCKALLMISIGYI